jgi:hypothetical protein
VERLRKRAPRLAAPLPLPLLLALGGDRVARVVPLTLLLVTATPSHDLVRAGDDPLVPAFEFAAAEAVLDVDPGGQSSSLGRLAAAFLRNASPRNKASVEEQCHEADKVVAVGGPDRVGEDDGEVGGDEPSRAMTSVGSL